jgi:RHS repeat-associated protein
MVRGGQTFRLVTDQLGSLRFVVDSSTGEIAQEINYDPVGEVISDSAPGFQPFGFAGGLYSSETGLTHFGAREYDAGLGRWTSSDPISFGGGDANLYGYVMQDPVNLRDPTGLFGLGAVGDFVGDVGDFVVEHGDTIAMVGAAGVCLASAPLCAAALAASSAVAATYAVDDFANGRTCLTGLARDLAIAAVPGGIGRAPGLIARASRRSTEIFETTRGLGGVLIRGNLQSMPVVGDAVLNEGLEGSCGC